MSLVLENHQEHNSVQATNHDQKDEKQEPSTQIWTTTLCVAIWKHQLNSTSSTTHSFQGFSSSGVYFFKQKSFTSVYCLFLKLLFVKNADWLDLLHPDTTPCSLRLNPSVRSCTGKLSSWSPKDIPSSSTLSTSANSCLIHTSIPSYQQRNPTPRTSQSVKAVPKRKRQGAGLQPWKQTKLI